MQPHALSATPTIPATPDRPSNSRQKYKARSQRTGPQAENTKECRRRQHADGLAELAKHNG
jgi:hypothetical protein